MAPSAVTHAFTSVITLKTVFETNRVTKEHWGKIIEKKDRHPAHIATTTQKYIVYVCYTLLVKRKKKVVIF